MQRKSFAGALILALTPALTTGVVGGVGAIMPISAAGAAVTCQGVPATIVGTSGRVVGTEGRDVIVADNHTIDVRALGGDDLVCLVSRRGGGNSISADAGPGDDVVDTTGADPDSVVSVALGAGADRFVGGPASDSVTTDAPGSAETDVVSTGADEDGDWISSGTAGFPNTDDLDLGPGDDGVLLRGTALTGPPIRGGDGQEQLVLDDPDGHFRIDAGTGEVRRDDAPWARLEGTFTRFRFDRAPAGLSFAGTERDESLTVATAYAGPARAIRMGGGADDVTLYGAPVPGDLLEAGAGRDSIVVAAPAAELSLDLASGRFDVAAVADPGRATARGFESAYLLGDRLTLRGTSGPDTLWLTGCTTTVKGRRGADIVRHSGDRAFEETEKYTCAKPSARVHGGRGHDDIRGSFGADRLYGNRGRDVVNGWPGRDLCRAEKKRGCER